MHANDKFYKNYNYKHKMKFLPILIYNLNKTPNY